MSEIQAPPAASAAPESTPVWRNPYVLAVLAGLIIIPLMRPFLRFEPPPPPVIGQLPAFRLTDSLGQPFGSAELEGQVYVVDFIFTRCASICPLLTAAMSRLDRRYVDEGIEGIRLLSVTVDPDYDTPEVLRDYGDAHRIDPARWTLLTGPESEIRELVTGGFKTAIGEPRASGDNLIDIAHSGKFVLVDGRGGIRGYYDTDESGLDEIFHRSQHVLREQR